MNKKIKQPTTPSEGSNWRKYIDYAKNFAKNFTTALLITLSITGCSPRSSQEIEAELSDVEAELLTRGDNQEEINKEGKIYEGHFGKGDDEQIADMERGTAERKEINIKEFNKKNKERNKLLKERDKAKAREARETRKAKEFPRLTGTNYDENELKNATDAIKESMKIRNENKNSK